MKSFYYGGTRGALIRVLISAIFIILTNTPLFAAQVTLEWTSVSQADSYKVFQRLEETSYDYNTPAWTGTATTCTINNLADDGTHFFVVRACAGTDQSGDSNEVSQLIMAPPPQITHTISATAGANGSISPQGLVSVKQGDMQTFSITPSPGFRISDVKADGVSSGAVSSYTFSDIYEDHAIEASFTAVEYTITSTTGPGGTISPNGSVNIVHNGSQSFSITPSTGHTIADVLVDGVSVGAVAAYAFSQICENHSIEARFAANEYNITASSGPGGTLMPEGLFSLAYGSSQSYTIFPSEGYRIADVRIDGSSAGTISSYTFSGIDADHTIEAVFEPAETVASLIVDDGDEGTSMTGDWFVSGGTDPFGPQSLYSKDVGADYTYQPGLTGRYRVSMWWSGYNSRCSNIPVEIHDGDLLLDTILVDQSLNSGQWNILGAYEFKNTAKIVVVAEDSQCSSCADAMKFDLDQGTVVIDESDPGTSSTGTWLVSGGSDPYGDQSLYSKDVGAEYSFESQLTGRYQVALWWSGYSSRCSNVPVSIYDDLELLDTVYVDQSSNGGQWNPLGVYYFDGTARVVISARDSQCSTSADAVQFAVDEEPIVIDDGDTGTAATGSWSVSGGSDPYGPQSLYSKDVGAHYTYTSQLAGLYEVALWWSGYNSRCSNVPVEIYDGAHLLDVVTIDQTQNSGHWYSLGNYRFNGEARVSILSESTDCSTSADALQFSK